MSSPAQPSSPECETLLQLMRRSESLYLAALENVSPAQAAFKPRNDRWSIAEVAEHVVAVEEFLLMLTKNASPSTEETDLRIDERLHRGAADRRRTFEAPEHVRPCGRFHNLSETAAQFCEARQKTVEHLQQSQAALRRLRVAHPVAGNIDAYQNLLILAYHPERHVGQIAEIKADPAYPA